MARLVGQQIGYLRLLIAAVCLAGGIALALHHPLWPMASLALFCLVSVVAALRPGLWLTFVPAGLPFLNFAPWTGWLIFDEFDILLLATLAGSYAHWGWNSPSRLCTPLHWPKRTCTYGWVHDLWSPRLFFLTVCVLGLGRGFLDAGGFHFDWFAGYADAPNSLRIFKPVAWSFLLVPLLRQTIAESPSRAQQRLAIGRAILHDPKLLVLDEPDASLGSDGAELLAAVMKDRTVVLATHDHALANRLCQRTLTLRHGRSVGTATRLHVVK